MVMSLMSSQLRRVSRVLAAVRANIGRFARSRPGDAGVSLDLVTVGSIVRVFAVDALRETTLILAPGARPDASPGHVPADSPIGAALFGGRAGETRQWESPSGTRRLIIVDIVGHIPECAWEPAAERRAVPRRAREADAATSRETVVPAPVVGPLPAAA